MTAFFSHGRSAFVAALLLFSVALLLPVTAARAGIAYSFVDYPLDERQTTPFQPGQDTISGTIVTDGFVGSAYGDNPGHILGGTLTLTTPGGSYTGVDMIVQGNPDSLAFTTDGNNFLLPVGGLIFFAAVVPDSGGELVSFEYWNNEPGDSVFQCGLSEPDHTPLTAFYGRPTPNEPLGGISANDPWIIASGGQPVPEPGTLTLLASALLGLVGAVCLRRRRAKN